MTQHTYTYAGKQERLFIDTTANIPIPIVHETCYTICKEAVIKREQSKIENSTNSTHTHTHTHVQELKEAQNLSYESTNNKTMNILLLIRSYLNTCTCTCTYTYVSRENKTMPHKKYKCMYTCACVWQDSC